MLQRRASERMTDETIIIIQRQQCALCTYGIHRYVVYTLYAGHSERQYRGGGRTGARTMQLITEIKENILPEMIESLPKEVDTSTHTHTHTHVYVRAHKGWRTSANISCLMFLVKNHAPAVHCYYVYSAPLQWRKTIFEGFIARRMYTTHARTHMMDTGQLILIYIYTHTHTYKRVIVITIYITRAKQYTVIYTIVRGPSRSSPILPSCSIAISDSPPTGMVRNARYLYNWYPL